MVYFELLVLYLTFASASIGADRVKRQFETEVRVKTSNNEWTTTYQQSLDSLLEGGVPKIVSRGLPGPAQTPEFPFRAYGSPTQGYSLASPVRFARQDGAQALFGSTQSSTGSSSGNSLAGSSSIAPFLNYFYPDPLVKNPPAGETIGDPHDNKYLFDLTRFDAVPGQIPPQNRVRMLRSRDLPLMGANPPNFPIQYFYQRNAPLIF
ncbi:unnamed protein product, partial [Mesorhabditis belari]|uniref:Uncharacterized protein n=1 Tax=Mesorhabditis belari TaxID=2138241 RepID=A0AAF3F076_9BILA